MFQFGIGFNKGTVPALLIRLVWSCTSPDCCRCSNVRIAFVFAYSRALAKFMQQSPAEVFEWHIFETVTTSSVASTAQAIHMGPFSTEQECRTVLARITQIPGLDRKSVV